MSMSMPSLMMQIVMEREREREINLSGLDWGLGF